MRSAKQLSVTLPNAMAKEVAAKIASDEYAGERGHPRRTARVSDPR